MTCRPRQALLASLLLPCAACADGGSDVVPGEITRRDSAGVEIVEIPRATLESLPVRRVYAQPSFTVGVAEGRDEEMFGQVSDALLLPDGAAAIADAQQRRVLIFEPDGMLRHAIGGVGRGPGEFRSVTRLALIGDTLFIPDLDGGRVQAFRTDGTLLGTRPLTGSVGLQMGLEYHRPGRFTAPHVFWITEEEYPRDVAEGDGPHRILQVIARHDTLGGTRIDTIRSAPGYWIRLGAEERAAATEEGLTHYPVGNVAPHPLAPDAHVAFLIDRPVTAWSATPELRMHTEDGEVERIIRFDAPATPAAADEDRYREWVLSFYDRNDRPLMRRAWRILARPAEPAHGRGRPVDCCRAAGRRGGRAAVDALAPHRRRRHASRLGDRAARRDP